MGALTHISGYERYPFTKSIILGWIAVQLALQRALAAVICVTVWPSASSSKPSPALKPAHTRANQPVPSLCPDLVQALGHVALQQLRPCSAPLALNPTHSQPARIAPFATASPPVLPVSLPLYASVMTPALDPLIGRQPHNADGMATARGWHAMKCNCTLTE